jgi:hypothetical protein
MPRTRGSRHGSKGGGKLPPSLNPREMVMRKWMKMRKRGRQLALSLLHPLKSSPCLATFSANKRGSPLARAEQNALEQEPEHLSAHRHSLVLCWYILTYRE